MPPLRPRQALLATTATAVVSLLLATSSVAAQAPAPNTTAVASGVIAPAYDVMTIKLNKSLGKNLNIDSGNGRYSATNVSLKTLLSGIYNIKENLISGLSGPLESARFDIEAKVSDPDGDTLKKMPPDQERKMLLPLLADRFQLKTHIETRTLPIFELIVLPSGTKFKPSPDQTEGGDFGISVHGTRTGSTLTAHDISMTSFAKSVTGSAGRAVIDKTGLTGNYDLTLQWSNDDNPAASAEQAPSIFTALPEQLGLKLQPAKGPVETLVVDRAGMPTDN